MSSSKELLERLKNGAVFCAEGYIFELERRGYVKAGAYIPELLLEAPEAVYQLHREFVKAGTDVTLALTYYAHREKLKAIGRENDLEAMNRTALKIAGEVARESGTLFAGNICNTGAYDINDEESSKSEVRRQFEEQILWAVEAGVDFVIAETLEYLGEALIALEVIKKHDLPAVINFTTNFSLEKSKDGYEWVEACKILAGHGADVVGFNCGRGPATMLPLMRRLREAITTPIAALPVAYRTTPEKPTFRMLENSNGQSAYTLGLDEFLCTRQEMAEFAAEAQKIGVEFIGICCGGAPHHVRAMVEALGRTTPASKYSPDMSQHYIVGSNDYAKEHEKQHLEHSPSSK